MCFLFSSIILKKTASLLSGSGDKNGSKIFPTVKKAEAATPKGVL